MHQLYCIFTRACRRNINRVSVVLLITLFMVLTAQTAMAATKTVSYIDADGTVKTVNATVLTGNETKLGTYDTNWYVVYNDISYSGKIYCNFDVNIILCDGVKMTMTNDDSCISGSSSYTLTIYGQTKGTGTLEATTTGGYHTIGHRGRMVINGGTVNVTNTNANHAAISSEGGITINGGIVNATCLGYGGYGITSAGVITINGGIVNATCTGSSSYGIYSSETITLGWTNTSDRITASSYGRTVTIADGKVFEDTEGNLYAGTLTSNEVENIQGHELAPNLDAYTVKAFDVEGVTVTANCRFAKEGRLVNVTAKATEAGYLIGAKYNDGTDHELEFDSDGKCSFTMPAANVEVSGTKTAAFVEGDGTKDNPFLIKDENDWSDFLNLINSKLTYEVNKDKCFKLDNDVSTTKMVGTLDYPFCGTFDGQGNTLTVDYSPTSQACAPFSYVCGTSSAPVLIKNLHIAGTIKTTKAYAAGIVGMVMENGYLTIENCRSNVDIKSSFNGNGYYSGFVSRGEADANISIKGCVFDGSINAAKSGQCAGFFASKQSNDVKVTIDNCLFAPTSIKVKNNGNKTFARNGGTITKCYYTKTLGTAQGKQAYEVSSSPELLGSSTGDGIVKTYGTYGLGFNKKYYLAKIPLSDSETEGVSYLTKNLQGKTVPVVFKREFSAGKASTICLPFAMDKVSGGKVYSFAGITYDEKDGWVATMSETGGNNVTKTEANTPYVFMPDADGEVTFSGTTEKIPAAYDAKELSTVSNDWTFQGTYEQLKYGSNLDGHVYGFASTDKEVDGVKVSAGEFVKAKAGAGVKPMRCYLTYNKNNGEFAGARAVTRGIDENLPQSITVKFVGANGETTGIATLNTQTGEITTDDAWYTLSGTRLPGKPSQRGIYINKGKAVYIKH